MELSLQPVTDQNLVVQQVRRCLAGDALAWRELVGSYYRLIYYLCYKSTGSGSDAEDLTQDIFLKVFCNLSRFDSDKGSFQNWLKNVTRNHLVDHFRATQVIRASDSLDAGLWGKEDSCTRASNSVPKAHNLIDVRPSPEQSFASLEVRTRIYAALGQVSATSRDAVILCDLEDRDYLEAAQILGIPVGTVKSRVNRGRAELGRILSAEREADVRVLSPRRRATSRVKQVRTKEVRVKEVRVKTQRRFGHSLQYQPSVA
jgi:RNA polymerase sigma-70 factor (ECF subfamily)